MKKVSYFLIGLIFFPILTTASPCDKTIVEIFNQTSAAFKLVDKDAYGNSMINNIAINASILPYSRQDLKIYSGLGTLGGAKGILSFVASGQDYSDVKFIALDINLKNRIIFCDVNVTVKSANYNQFDAYVIPGYSKNNKVYIIGQ